MIRYNGFQVFLLHSQADKFFKVFLTPPVNIPCGGQRFLFAAEKSLGKALAALELFGKGAISSPAH